MERLREAFTAVGRTVAEHPGTTLGVAFVLILVSVGGAANITSVTGNEAFVSEDPTLNTYQESFDRKTIAVLVDGDVTDPATLTAVDRFDRRISEVENVRAVATPADEVRAAYARVPGSSARIREVIDPSSTTVVSVVLEADLSQGEQRDVYEAAVDAKDWASFPAGVDVVVTGQPAFTSQLNRLIGQSTSSLLGLAVGLMILALFFLFRGVRLRLLPIVAVFVGVIYTFGAMGFTGVPNSTLTSAVFPILIGLGIDYSVQFHQRYEEELEDKPPRDALPAAVGGIGPPVLIAMLAAALGFGATWLSTIGVPAFVWFAQTSIFGVFLTFLTAIIVLLPALTLYVRYRGDGEEDNDDGDEIRKDDDGEVGTAGRALGAGSRKLAEHPAPVILLAGIVMVGGMYASTTLDTLADPEEFVPDDLPALLDLQQFRDETGGGSANRYDMLVTGGDLRNPETLSWMEEFRDVVTEAGSVTGVESPATLVKANNGGEIPATTAGVEAVLAELPRTQTARFYSDGYTRMTVLGERGLSTGKVISLTENVDEAVETSRPPPGVDAELTGTNVIAPGSTVEQIESRNGITALGVLFVFVLLLLYYRHPVKSVAPLIPMLFVVGWQNVYMYIFEISVSPLGASLGALSVGIGAEYTIIVMERYYEEREKGVAPLDAVETAGQRVGKAISVSGMTTVFGFSALTLSPFPILGDFGYLTVGVIFLTLIAALTTLPPVLIVMDSLKADTLNRLRAKEASAEPSE
ncbi:RND family transporter [Haladaptatus sp. F3-133]|jgi:hydrophobe/amphiphile efflux-3 (HAE3) family protein|uniref:RND family transporter n=1 Tax=Halorutilus salinus TaxID=2487751 RepID=A0A9Q4C5S2_9EURY|nr:RND family transporter [Halorutilus salinus]MCX2818904.1 RND family transporter [Halorutilus salinus]